MLTRQSIFHRSIGDFFQTAPQKKEGRQYDNALRFIKRRFAKVAKGNEHRISVFVTCATDKKQAQRIIDDTAKFIMTKNILLNVNVC